MEGSKKKINGNDIALTLVAFIVITPTPTLLTPTPILLTPTPIPLTLRAQGKSRC
uniref:Uncharacterized protein n=1 Tax=Arion vulgaris TaxID=1028688 RepID=A0A0B7BP40_9EUPU